MSSNEIQIAPQVQARRGRSYRYALHGLLLAALQAVAACAADTGDATPEVGDDAPSPPASQDEPAVEQQLAMLTVRGVEVKFVQVADDNVLVLALSRTLDNPLNDRNVQGLSIAQMYELWAGAPAPNALAKLPAAHRIPTPAAAPAEAEPQRPGAINKQTAGEFRAEFCQGPLGGSWDTCMTDVWLEEVDYSGRATQVNGAISMINGDGVVVRVREERPVKGWHSLPLMRVGANQLMRWRASMGGFYARRIEILVQERAEDISEGTGFFNSDRFHYMRNIRVD